MSDGGFKGSVAEAVKTVNEAVVEPVKDEVGQLREAGVQAVTGFQSDPQKQFRKQQEEQKKLADAQYKITWWKQIAAQQASLRQQNQQEQMQKQQEKQQEKQVKQFEIVQKKQENKQSEQVKRTRAELKAGKGMGG